MFMPVQAFPTFANGILASVEFGEPGHQLSMEQATCFALWSKTKANMNLAAWMLSVNAIENEPNTTRLMDMYRLVNDLVLPGHVLKHPHHTPVMHNNAS
jgi:hypothetical protein